MRIRSIYFKTRDMARATEFWIALLQQEPAKRAPRWTEFRIADIGLGLLLDDFDDQASASGCVPVLELGARALPAFVERARMMGAEIVLDALDDPRMNSIVLAAQGMEFEVCRRA